MLLMSSGILVIDNIIEYYGFLLFDISDSIMIKLIANINSPRMMNISF